MGSRVRNGSIEENVTRICSSMLSVIFCGCRGMASCGCLCYGRKDLLSGMEMVDVQQLSIALRFIVCGNVLRGCILGLCSMQASFFNWITQ